MIKTLRAKTKNCYVDYDTLIAEDMMYLWKFDFPAAVQKELDAMDSIDVPDGRYYGEMIKSIEKLPDIDMQPIQNDNPEISKVMKFVGIVLHHSEPKQEVIYQTQKILRLHSYEKNDSKTRNDIATKVEAIIDRLKTNKQLYDGRVICDETNNTLDIIDQNQLKCTVGLKFDPTSSEFTKLDFIVGSVSGDIDEIV